MKQKMNFKRVELLGWRGGGATKLKENVPKFDGYFPESTKKDKGLFKRLTGRYGVSSTMIVR